MVEEGLGSSPAGTPFHRPTRKSRVATRRRPFFVRSVFGVPMRDRRRYGASLHSVSKLFECRPWRDSLTRAITNEPGSHDPGYGISRLRRLTFCRNFNTICYIYLGDAIHSSILIQLQSVHRQHRRELPPKIALRMMLRLDPDIPYRRLRLAHTHRERAIALLPRESLDAFLVQKPRGIRLDLLHRLTQADRSGHTDKRMHVVAHTADGVRL